MSLSPSASLRIVLLAASVAVVACDDVGPIAQAVPTAVFEPDVIDFGEVTVGTTVERDVSLKNTGSMPFGVATVESPGGYYLSKENKDAAEGELLPIGGSLALKVGFVAQTEGVHEGDLKVFTESGQEALLKVHAVGVIRRAPQLSLDPNSLSFGTVELGKDARLTTSVRNNGNGPGAITSVTLESSGASAASGTEYSVPRTLPMAVAEGAQEAIEVVFTPAREGQRPDRLIFAVDGGYPALVLDLRGVGQSPLGALLCAPSNVSFGQVERQQVGRQQVRCTARGGALRVIGARIGAGGPDFALPSPVGTADLADGQSIDIPVEFHAAGLPGARNGELQVDFNGASGQQTASVPMAGEVIPPPPTGTAVSLILRWDTNATDMDIHLVRPGGRAFASDGSDCFYMEMNPDWGVAGDAVDNPFLDVDDVDGRGPEIINLSETAPGDYQVWVHSFQDSGGAKTRATVEVHIGGTLAGTFSHNLECKQLWQVGTIRWTGTGGTFTPSITVIPTLLAGRCT